MTDAHLAITVLFLFLGMRLGVSIARHGEEVTLRVNGWNKLVDIVLFAALLWWGGML